ncbi:MAG: tRNA pseudouridine(55) synthase TruB [Candidatus Omnitrophica bacterium]|nr:tRNA pseudouridine(55) synthase TruB [Candidatus Omnitrophota bacterium]
MRKASFEPGNGILLVDKPKGVTSHDVVDAIRRKFGFKKVGHAGTLDPLATGLLVILIGAATKLSDQFLNHDKAYEAHVRLGVITDTGDADGTVLEEMPCTVLPEDVRRVMAAFTGEIEQVPPMFSAKKYQGKKLYQYARRGVTVERKPAKVCIRAIEIVSIALPEVRFTVACSKGTYIRQLSVDIGRSLGCGGHLMALRRTRSGDLDVKNAFTLDAIIAMTDTTLHEHLITCF